MDLVMEDIKSIRVSVKDTEVKVNGE